MSCAKDEIVTTVGMPHHLMASKHGWFYLCCDHCSKSIITKSPLYTCSDPQHVTPDPKMKDTKKIIPSTVLKLTQMLDDCNVHTQSFRIARDRLM
ncbi:hypothetical protein P8452_12900 [Trifolium repens]|nr:hypothetical protein P8452_12900 [Trifolium repens]